MTKRVEIPFRDQFWASHIMNAVKEAEPGDTIVVHTASHVHLATGLLKRAGKAETVMVEMTDKLAKLFLTGELKQRDPREVAEAMFRALTRDAQARSTPPQADAATDDPPAEG